MQNGGEDMWASVPKWMIEGLMCGCCSTDGARKEMELKGNRMTSRVTPGQGAPTWQMPTMYPPDRAHGAPPSYGEGQRTSQISALQHRRRQLQEEADRLHARLRENFGVHADSDTQRLQAVEKELATLHDQITHFENDAKIVRARHAHEHDGGRHSPGGSRHESPSGRHGHALPGTTHIPGHATGHHMGSDWFDRHSTDPHVVHHDLQRHASPDRTGSEHAAGHGFAYTDKSMHSATNPNCHCEFYDDGVLKYSHPECPLGYNHRESRFNDGDFGHEHSKISAATSLFDAAAELAHQGSPLRHGMPHHHHQHEHHEHHDHHHHEGHHKHADGRLMSSDEAKEYQHRHSEQKRIEDDKMETLAARMFAFHEQDADKIMRDDPEEEKERQRRLAARHRSREEAPTTFNSSFLGSKHQNTVHRGDGDDNDVGQGMRGMMNQI